MPAAKPPTTVVSTKGQVILPKSIRAGQGWVPGTKLIVEDTDEGVLLRALPAFARTRLEDVYGMLRVKGGPKSLKVMDEGILAEARRRHAGN
jgi:AbrB family looped-hinge helix DNA binding protein